MTFIANDNLHLSRFEIAEKNHNILKGLSELL